MSYEGHSTVELLKEGHEKFDGIGKCAKTRRRRDRAFDQLTDLFLVVEALGRRLRLLEWDQRVDTSEDEDEAEPIELRREISLHELMSLTSEEDPVELDDDDIPALKRRIRDLEERCVGLFRGVIRYTTAGCSSAEQVTKKWLALIRRVDPDALADIGTSQTAVARVLGERRATTSAREKREFEEPMKRAGARGWRGGAGGLRSEQNRRNCAKAQRGNRNRANGHAASHLDDELTSHLGPDRGGHPTKRKRTTS